jgi:uncharacterized phage protein gp47/JayE
MWGALKGVYPEPAVATQGTVAFTGTNGVPLPIGTAFNRIDGIGFTTTAAGTVSSSMVTVPCICTTPGTIGNTVAGTAVNLASGVSGINGGGAWVSTTTTGIDAEDINTAFKTRYLQEYAAPPQGGDQADYVEWAEDVPGVTRAWCLPMGMGAGTVVVYFMMDLAEAASGGFPQGSNGVSPLDNNGVPRDTVATGDQLTVADALAPLAPVPALVYACAPAAQDVAFVIADLGTSNIAAIQALITASLVGMFQRAATALGGTIYPSSWETAIAAVPGVTQFNVTTPSGPITSTAGNLPTLGATTFTT